MRSGPIIVLLALSLSLSACGGSPLSGTQQTLTVSAAANVESAFGEVATAFEKQTGTRVTFNFGSTGQLAQQIAQGAPVDLFVAADRATVDDLAAKGYVLPDTVRLYARGEIVLYMRADSHPLVQTIKDLVRPEVKRIAIANPERAPYGQAAKEALNHEGVWNQVSQRVILTENIQQTKEYADTGNVDVAITARSLVVGSAGTSVSISQDLYSPINQALGVVKGAKNEQGARRFSDFLLGEQGRAIMTKYGYGLP